MSSPNIDIDFLARETLALSEALKGSEDFGQTSLFDKNFEFTRDNDFILGGGEKNIPPIRSDIEDDSRYQEKLPQELTINFEEDQESLPEVESTFPTSPGVIFKIDSGVATFCVRGILCHNINESVHGVMNNENDSWKKLKIRDREELSGIHYFETSSISQSEMIAEYIINKRFPIQEEMVCNLSDPGFSWWLESNEHGMKVYF